LTGIVTTLNGDAIANATITLGSQQATSDSTGVYLFSDVKAGTYTIKAEAEGKLAKEAELVVEQAEKSQNLVWNVSLAADVKQEIPVSATVENKGDVETEALKDNDQAIVNVEAVVPAGAIETDEGEDVRVFITPIYDANVEAEMTKAGSRADESTLLLGATLSCNKAEVTLTKPVDLGFSVDDEVAQSVEAMQLKNGEWVPVASRIEDGKVIIEANEFTSYGLFLGVTFSVGNGSEPITFEQDKWDNLYGSRNIYIRNANYTYKAGTEITTKATSVLTALLVEKLAQRFGATVSTVQGAYPLNVSLPIGTILNISGTQSKQTVSASAKGKSVSGMHYGTVTVVVTTSNRMHNGGTN
ncbi:MAG: carboxypeptidase-like regulatory domain-containing protein, partial [Bacteroidaceae bacterium]|nr:carboxypeptidase-like regulatory domain-containing protein [Bacteroidaceae bacterium]